MEIFDKRPAHRGSDSVRNSVRWVHYQKRQVSHADSGIKGGRICHPMGSAGDLGPVNVEFAGVMRSFGAVGFQLISHFWNWSSRAPAAARTTRHATPKQAGIGWLKQLVWNVSKPSGNVKAIRTSGRPPRTESSGAN
jgi:hypothetical protein